MQGGPNTSWVTRMRASGARPLLDHRTKRVTTLRLARSVDFLLFVDNSRHPVVLIEHSDRALYIGQQPGSELFATVVVDAKGYGQLDEVGLVNWSCASAAPDESTTIVPRGIAACLSRSM